MCEERGPHIKTEATKPLDCREEGTTTHGPDKVSGGKADEDWCRQRNPKGTVETPDGSRPDTMAELTGLRAATFLWVSQSRINPTCGLAPSRTRFDVDWFSGRDCQILQRPHDGPRRGESNRREAEDMEGYYMLEDSSRVVDPTDQSVVPSRDTGFRMAPQPEFKYIRRTDTVDNRPFLDYVHWDDMKDIGQGTLRSQPLDSVRVYEIDFAAVERRVIRDIRCSVIRAYGDSPCLCMLPGSVPCTDCGAGL